MLCLAFLFGSLAVINAEIKPISNEKNFDLERAVRCLLQKLDILKYYKPTVLVVASEVEDLITENDIFIDTAINEAVKYQIPFILTDNVNVLHEINHTDRGTIFSISAFEKCEALTQFTKVMDKKIKYYIKINSTCEATINDTLQELQYYDVKFIIIERRTGIFTSLNVISEMNEKSCRSVARITRKIFKPCYSYSIIEKGLSERSSLRTPLDLKKCKFNVGMATLYPYSMINNKKNLKTFDPIDNVYGADVELIKIVTNYFNATLSLYYVERSEENPYLNKEFVNFLTNGSLDACAGGLYKIYGDGISYSGIYSSQSVIWIYTVERTTKSWHALVSKMSGLYIFFIFYIIHSIVWVAVCKFDGRDVLIKDALLYSWGTLVGTTSLQDARTIKQKTLNILYITMSLYLSTYLSCIIYSYLTVEEPPPHFKTVDELQMSDRTLFLVFPSKYFITDKKYEKYANTSRDCTNFEDCEMLMLKNKGSTIVIDGHLPHLQASTAVNDEARVLRVSEEILTVYHEMLIRKDSPLLKGFEIVTERLFNAGICRRLYDEAIGITVIDRAKIANENIISNSYGCKVGCKITVPEIAGIFYIWFLGCVISFCVFVIEIHIVRQKRAM